MPNVSSGDLEAAAAQLARSERGRHALRDLLALLENGGVSLDGDNQRHVLCLLAGAWGSHAGTALTALRGAVEPEDEPAAVEAAAT